MKLLKIFNYSNIMGGSDGFTIMFSFNINRITLSITFLLSEESCIWENSIIDFRGRYAKSHKIQKIKSNIKSTLTDDFMYEYQHNRQWDGIPKNFFQKNPEALPNLKEMEIELKQNKIASYFITTIFESLS